MSITSATTTARQPRDLGRAVRAARAAGPGGHPATTAWAAPVTTDPPPPGVSPPPAVRSRRGGRPEARLVADPWLSSTVTIPADRCGPPGMGNGGWVSGTVASHLGRGPIEVTLHAPTPLDVPLGLGVADDDASLDDAGRVVVTARRVAVTPVPPAAVTWDEAVAAGEAFAGHHDHPFPGCFVCGTDRGHGDGLRLFAGPVAGLPGTVAAAYIPHPAHTHDGRRLPPAGVWALLDCPSAWVAYGPGKVAVLGQLTAEVTGAVEVGRRYVVVARIIGEEGRRLRSRVAVHDVDAGRLIATGLATWVRILAPG